LFTDDARGEGTPGETDFAAVCPAASFRRIKDVGAGEKRTLAGSNRKNKDGTATTHELWRRIDMARQGRVFSQEEIERITWLLTSTDMTMKQIAQRMQCSHSAVVSINRKSRVRTYAGRRSSWIELKHDCA